MAAETGFIIDGNQYPIPTLDTLTMDEALVLYDYSGLTIEDFVEADEGDTKFKNPGFHRALMHIAFQRGNPNINANRVKALIGSANQLDMIVQVAEAHAAEADVDPPASTTGPNESSERSSSDSTESSGSLSETGSVAPVVPLVPITPGSSPPSGSTQTTLVS